MPISYGQVAGRKTYGIQVLFDPANPKRTIYGSEGAKAVLVHGALGYSHGCRCGKCKAAHAERKRVLKANKYSLEHGGLLTCTRCGKAQEQGEFPSRAKPSSNVRFVCKGCL